MVILPMVCSIVSMVSVPFPIRGADPPVEGVAGVALLVMETVAPVVTGTVLSFSLVKIISGSLASGVCFPLFDPDLHTSKPNLCLISFMCLFT